MDTGSIDVHCVVVVYEFLCGWCVLNCSGSQQTALITSDTPAQPCTLARGLSSQACCLPCTSTYEIRKIVQMLKTRRDFKARSCLNKTLLMAVVNRDEGEVLIIMYCFWRYNNFFFKP